jgi:hypothetical protein
MTDPKLPELLSQVIPLCLAELKALDDRQRLATVKEWHSRALAVSDDDCRRGTTKAQAGLDLAHGLALLACKPGGVHAANRLWCARHHPAGTTAEHCTACLDAEDSP